eukprot:CAMPEP_0181196858 /NCGR_PEP_ID=MMETSP1096-20121128/15705_1 /TAXON_ID=156174 ORGANISM="Chrysochromulina ericina, Strain CCMP281" /NCGR_SAMPLE_ID=MMETSP1096 /ASSEMBLY_ACC=CAM_ASM_000453 /LENGTH=183 /DNA_ID=CAMNT_0023286677 /DNA_START=580 /DNA_END=1133 /DNA_ORIENTATION=-
MASTASHGMEGKGPLLFPCRPCTPSSIKLVWADPFHPSIPPSNPSDLVNPVNPFSPSNPSNPSNPSSPFSPFSPDDAADNSQPLHLQSPSSQPLFTAVEEHHVTGSHRRIGGDHGESGDGPTALPAQLRVSDRLFPLCVAVEDLACGMHHKQVQGSDDQPGSDESAGDRLECWDDSEANCLSR